MNGQFDLHFWRFTLGLMLNVNPIVLRIGAGIAINPHGDHPHIVGSLSLLFIDIGLTFSICMHPLNEHA